MSTIQRKIKVDIDECSPKCLIHKTKRCFIYSVNENNKKILEFLKF